MKNKELKEKSRQLERGRERRWRKKTQMLPETNVFRNAGGCRIAYKKTGDYC